MKKSTKTILLILFICGIIITGLIAIGGYGIYKLVTKTTTPVTTTEVVNTDNTSVIPDQPNAEELHELATVTNTQFLEYAINEEYEKLYQWISPAWRTTTSTDEMKNVVQSGFTKEQMISLQSGEISITEPVYNKAAGTLDIYGTIYTEEFGQLSLELYFSYDYPDWKLDGFKYGNPQ